MKIPVSQKTPTLFVSFIPIIFLIILLTFNVIFWKDDTLSGSNQVALLLAGAVGAIIATRLGVNWEKIRDSIVNTIGKSMQAILILLLIGALSGTWLLSGTIPTLIYYGLDVLHPSIFLFAAVIISGLVSLATGSSWSTIATIGVALLGIGNTIGIDNSITAGAIISGAYFGDKMSPLSDTTNLAPAMAGTDLFTHIKYMLYTTVPSMTITLIIFFIIGLTYDFNSSSENITEVQNIISNTFYISPILLLVPAFLIFIIIKKIKPIPAMLAGILIGGLFAVVFQPNVIKEYSKTENNYAKASYIGVMNAMYGDLQINIKKDKKSPIANQSKKENTSVMSDKQYKRLFHTSGMAGMLNTIWLILSAMVFGGVMEAGGMLKKIAHSVMKKAKSSGSLIASTAASCVFFNATASDQYIAIVVPGKMYSKIFKEKGLKPEVLSRTLEDSGTVTSVLIPWNTGGATQSKVLGVSTIDYLPYAFFNVISPIMTVIFAYLNIKIRRFSDDKKSEETV